MFEFLSIDISFSSTSLLTVIACYKPPSAVKEALNLLADVLVELRDREIVLMGDFNWDWL